MAAGVYGKLPSRGDFVSRRLPREFIEPWDAWLQAGIASSRTRLGEQWLEHYLTSPLWCFALGGGVCGAQPVAGVLMPSVDRVGRYFPLTLAQPLPLRSDLAALAGDGVDWFARLSALALRALDDDFDFSALDQALETLPAPPAAAPAAPRACVQQLDSPSAVQALARACLPADWQGATLWWSEGSEAIAPCRLLLAGLPAAEHFATLFTGEFAAAGYTLHTDEPAYVPSFRDP